MMSWLTPIGFLGLIGLIILIIIYIIKPNYQNKVISSTFIWKLSLKYTRRKIPISKLRNILLLICQILILTGAALMLAQPFISMDTSKSNGDVIIIVDSSASMHTGTAKQTRLERAIKAARTEADEALKNGNKVSVILAANKASFLVQQVALDQSQLVYDLFDQMEVEFEKLYTYGVPDIEGAMKLAEEITAYTKNARVSLYTDTQYLNAGNVQVHNVSDRSEWNAAILDVRAIMVENYYRIEIDVASYGADNQLEVMCEIFNVNDTGTTMEIELETVCSDDLITTLVLAYVADDMAESEAAHITENVSIFAYDQIYVHLSENDSLEYDNNFYLYGGKRPALRVQYSSPLPNSYWPSALMVLQDTMKEHWNLEIVEVPEGQEPALEGFDIYIFEHIAPKSVPTDGVVIYSDPDSLPSEAGVRFSPNGSQYTHGGAGILSEGESHPVMNNLDVSNVILTYFNPIISYDNYVPLAMYEQYPVVLLKEEVDQKILLLPFSMHYSNMALLPIFPFMLHNVINYFFPVTIEENKYEINDVVSLNARSDELNIVGPNTQITITKFPADLTLIVPGAFTLTQIPLSGKTVVDSIFVKIPAKESNINSEESVLQNPYFFEEAEMTNVDLLFYFALAVVGLLFIEWWLKSREQI